MNFMPHQGWLLVLLLLHVVLWRKTVENRENKRKPRKPNKTVENHGKPRNQGKPGKPGKPAENHWKLRKTLKTEENQQLRKTKENQWKLRKRTPGTSWEMFVRPFGKKIAQKCQLKFSRRKKQIVIPSENVIFGISKDLGLKSGSKLFVWWFASVLLPGFGPNRLGARAMKKQNWKLLNCGPPPSTVYYECITRDQ